MTLIPRLIYGCVLALAGCVFCSGQDAAQPAEVALCDLYKHPEQYNGKMIKVRGGSVSELRLENILHDSQTKPCPTYMRIVVVFPDQVKPSPAFQLIQDEAYKKLAEALHYPGPIHIDATYEGRFDAAFAWHDGKRIRVGQYAGKGYGRNHEYDARIVLHEVSNIWTMPLPRK